MFDKLEWLTQTAHAVNGVLQSTTLLSAETGTIACDPHANSLSFAGNNRPCTRLSAKMVTLSHTRVKIEKTMASHGESCCAADTVI